MTLEIPTRTKGELNTHWISRRDGYRIELLELQVMELQKAVFKKEHKK